MALEVKLEFVGQDRSGREIILRDATGFQAFGRLTGYAPGDPQAILAYHLSFGRIGLTEKRWTKIDGTNIHLPAPEQIAYGSQVRINTALLDDYTGEELLASRIFSDGVLDINMYVEFAGLSDVLIEAGTNFITGGNFSVAYMADAVLVNDTIYEIDKSQDHNGYSVLYVLGEFDADADSFTMLYRSNVKAMLASVSDYLHQLIVGKLAQCPDAYDWQTVSVGMAYREAAALEFAWDTPDYTGADRLLTARHQLLKEAKR